MNDDRPSELDAAREAIDAIDAELIRLLARRAEYRG
jgi:chorismate mutase